MTPIAWPADELAAVADPHSRLAIALLIRAADAALDAVQTHDLGWDGPTDDSALVEGYIGIEDLAYSLLQQWFAIDSSARGWRTQSACLSTPAQTAHRNHPFRVPAPPTGTV